MDEPTVKRVYTPPKIIRVKLNPEQAVLSPCSINATTLLDNLAPPVPCDSPLVGDAINCRKSDDGGAQDSVSLS